MRIEAAHATQAAGVHRARSGTAAVPVERPAVSETPADAVQLSRRTDTLKRAEAVGADADAARADRVAALQAQVQAGTYKVDKIKLAQAMVDYA